MRPVFVRSGGETTTARGRPPRAVIGGHASFGYRFLADQPDARTLAGEPGSSGPGHPQEGEPHGTPDAFSEHLEVPADAQTPTTAKRHGILERWRERTAKRKHARRISARNRRVLVQWLRLTAKHATDRDPIRRRHVVLLHYRAAAVRTDLLEIAALLERAHDPAPACIETPHALLANDGDSPLYNPNTPFTELQATLEHIRSGL